MFDAPPATWEELVAQSEAVTAPPVSGLGLVLSNVGDGNVQVSVLQSFAGYLADAIPGAQLVTLPGVTHFAPLQRPDLLNAVMLDTLKRFHGPAEQLA